MRNLWYVVLCTTVVTFLGACGGDKGGDGPGDKQDNVGDGDADTDADADSDTDADADTDSDADTDVVLPCADYDLGDSAPAVVTGTTVGGGDDSTGSCDYSAYYGYTGAADVNVQYTASAPGQYAFALTDTTDFDAVLYALRGCGGNEIDCNDYIGNGGDIVVADLDIYQSVVVVVDGWSGAEGNFELRVFEVPANETVCDDGIDEDLDGDPDCFDTDCAADPVCQEVCDDDLDNNGNGLVDCLDAACTADPVCAPQCPQETALGTLPETILGTSLGEPNQSEPTCGAGGASDWSIEYTAPQDGDYVFDLGGSAYDTVLAVYDSCGGAELDCNDDWLGLQSQVVVALTNGQTVLVDVDGFSSSSAGDFTLNVDLLEANETDCADGRDLDNDGDEDCFDDDCDGDPACVEICDDGIDNDGDFDTDCFDSSCDSDPLCFEDCSDLIDNDGDGDTDCADSACASLGACTPICPNDVVVGALPVAILDTTLGLPDGNTPSCATSYASDMTFEFTAPSAGTYVFDTAGTVYDTVLYALDACGGLELDCNDDTTGLQSEISLVLNANDTVIIVVDGFANSSGDFVLNVQ